MKVHEFVNKFIERNTLVRLWYKIPRGEHGAHQEVIEGDKPMMEWKLITSVYSGHTVSGVTDILYSKSPHVEAVNLVIERN